MSYRDLLSPWAICLLLPNAQRRRIAQFRKRNEAEEYFKVIRRLLPHHHFEIVYEIEQEWRETTICEAAIVDSASLSIKICEETEQEV